MGFSGLVAAQWRGLSLSWRPILLHVGAYALLCLTLGLLLVGDDVGQLLNRMVLVIAVASVMIQAGGFVARLLWLGVAIGEAGWLVARCTAMVLPQVPAGLVQLTYAGLLFVLFLLLARSSGDGGLRTLAPVRPLAPTAPPRPPAGVR